MFLPLSPFLAICGAPIKVRKGYSLVKQGNHKMIIPPSIHPRAREISALFATLYVGWVTDWRILVGLSATAVGVK